MFSSSTNPSLRGIKSNSTSQLPVVAHTSAATPQQSQSHDRSRSDTAEFSTLSRTPTPLSNGQRTPSPGEADDPDLAGEVSALSTKLINAINHQTNLDDSLQNARHELDAARARIAELESTTQQHEILVNTGSLVRREESDRIEQILKTEAADERLKRISAEKERKKLELELERLTSELFEEANSMVADARREKQEAEQQKEQYQTQLRDAEVLLASHQEQLRELKQVMQQLQSDERVEELTKQPSAPSTPIYSQFKKSTGPLSESAQEQPQPGQNSQNVIVDHPLSFSHLISPVFRSDIQAYDDFVQLLKMGGSASPQNRVGSGNFAGLNVMGLGSLTNPAQSKIEKQNFASKNSTSSLSTSSPAPQNMPGSFNATSPADVTSSPSTTTSLKESKYYKRAITEDIEPTLRLDLAPGLSWLARRNLISSMAAGNLIVEPAPAGPYASYSANFPCALCGEYRPGETYVRRHRFRTNDSDDATRSAVCDFCVGRLRAAADFVNFLRMVRSGYWRGESTEEARLAWEECVKLRERMFWSRIGGGVIPAQTDGPFTPRKTRHIPERSVSSANLDGPLVEEPGELADENKAEQQVDAPSEATRPDSSGDVVSTERPSTSEDDQTASQSPTRPPQTPRAEVIAATEAEVGSGSRGKSVEVLRSRFESPSQSRKSSESRRSGSRPRTKSRTPSPQKQF